MKLQSTVFEVSFRVTIRVRRSQNDSWLTLGVIIEGGICNEEDAAVNRDS